MYNWLDCLQTLTANGVVILSWTKLHCSVALGLIPFTTHKMLWVC